MAATIVGSAATAGTSITIPTHQVGDVILIWAYRDGSNTPATKPSASGTVPNWTTISAPNPAGNTNSSNSCWFRATATNTTSGTWALATAMAVVVIRGAAVTPVGGSARAYGTGTGPVPAPSITQTKTDGSSLLFDFHGHRSPSAWDAAPAGYTQLATVATEICVNTKDDSTSDGAVSQGVTATSNGYLGETIEILAQPVANSAIVPRQAAGSGHYGSGGFAPQSATFPNAVQSNATLVCFYWGNSNGGNATCADNVNGAWTALAQQTPVSGSGRRMNWFYLRNSASAPAGTMTVTVSPAAGTSGNTESMQIIEYSPTGPLDTNLTSAGVSATGTVPVQNTGTPGVSGCLILYGFASDTEGNKTFASVNAASRLVLATADGKTGGADNGSASIGVVEFLANGASFLAASMNIGVSDDGGKYTMGFRPPVTVAADARGFFALTSR